MNKNRAWIFLGLIILAVTGLVLANGLRGFLESELFRKLVERHTGSAFSGVAEWGPLRWSGSEARSGALRLAGGSNSRVESLEATTLQARVDWSAVLGGTWRVEEITVENLRAKFGSSGSAPPPGAESSPPAGLAVFLPSRFEIAKARIARADLDFGPSAILRTSLRIEPVASGWKFQGQGGEFLQAPLPPLAIESFVARTGDNAVVIESSGLRLGPDGKISVSGRWPGGLEIHWQDVSAADLLDSKWKNNLVGNLAGNARAEENRITGRLEWINGELRGFKTLEDIAVLVGRAEFRKLPIQKASADFQILAENYDLQNLRLESSGLLRVEGQVLISSDRQLRGELQLGLDASLLQGLPGAQSKVFTTSRDGLLWTPVVIGGTLDAPTENLSRRLVSAFGESAIEAASPVLEAMPVPARKAVDDTINTLFDILGR